MVWQDRDRIEIISSNTLDQKIFDNYFKSVLYLVDPVSIDIAPLPRKQAYLFFRVQIAHGYDPFKAKYVIPNFTVKLPNGTFPRFKHHYPDSGSVYID